MASNSSRQDAAKEKLRSPSTSVSQQRNNFRTAFLNRLRGVRNQQVDRLRQICEDNEEFNYQSLLDFKKAFQPDKTVQDLLKSETVMELLRQVESEMLLQQAEQLESAVDEETNAIVTTLLNNCKGCDKIIDEGDLCEVCTSELFSNDFSQS